MLVVSRKQGQRIVLGENIVLEVVEIRGNCVRLGFEAPREVPIVREELLPAEKQVHRTTDGDRASRSRRDTPSAAHGTRHP
ncbi:MAG: carbon storage regulator [Planctomycetota bacterium]|nr:MAG: carbon storage regulator [Planctomycetota bacterium]